MKRICACLMIFVLLAGCSDAGPMAVKRFPHLQRVCDRVAGGCYMVTLTCTVYDNTGNTTLRGVTVWEIHAGEVSGYAFKIPNHSQSSELLVDEAIADWIRTQDQMSAIDQQLHHSDRVYPNSRSCNSEGC